MVTKRPSLAEFHASCFQPPLVEKLPSQHTQIESTTAELNIGKEKRKGQKGRKTFIIIWTRQRQKLKFSKESYNC